MNLKCHDCGHEWDDANGTDCPMCGTPYSTADDLDQSQTSQSSSSKSRSSITLSNNISSLSVMVGDGSGKTKKRRRDLHSDSSQRSSSRRRGLGRGFVFVEQAPPIDALSLVQSGLSIPVKQRLCSNPNCCDEHGNRTRVGVKFTGGTTDNPGDHSLYEVVRDKGFCTRKITVRDASGAARPDEHGNELKEPCRTPYNFSPLEPETVVFQSYEVKGPIAVGGCGFVYLAWDLNVGQWVVLKGLINSKDQDALQTAMQERKFLADLRDRSLISILNFVPHEDQFFIVMEFCDGTTLKNILKANGKPLSLATALAYALGMLESFKFLATRRPRIIYCDGKLDNFMVQGNYVRMLDLGGARLESYPDDVVPPDYVFTKGYVAPEAGPDSQSPEPTLASDMYTVVRCLMLMTMEFDWKGKYRYKVPPAAEQPLLQQRPNFHRFLLKGIAENPDYRFQSAEEMEAQLEAMLREEAALESGEAKPADSAYFGADVHSITEALGYQLLPILKVDEDDPARGSVLSALAINDSLKQLRLFEQAETQFPKSSDAPLRVVHCLIELSEFDKAEAKLAELTEKDPFDWRNVWMKGRLALARQHFDEAYRCFDAVWSDLPGELIPRMAMGLVKEMAGDITTAIALYDQVSLVNPSYATAVFGLGRCLLATGDRAGAVAAYDRISPLSIAAVEAKQASIRALLSNAPTPPSEVELGQAAERMQAIWSNHYEAVRLWDEILKAALAAVISGRLAENASLTLREVPFTAKSLRLAAVENLRVLAGFADDPTGAIVANNRALLQGLPKAFSAVELANVCEWMRAVRVESAESLRLWADMLESAIEAVGSGRFKSDQKVTLRDIPLTETALRTAAEETLRKLSAYCDDPTQAIVEANMVRATSIF